MEKKSNFAITLFHCINAFNETIKITQGRGDPEFKIIKMACSSMTKDIFLLKAFEAGADAVLVLVCPEKACRYTEGSIRARKRVDWVKGILDEIGLGEKRLSLHNVAFGDEAAIQAILEKTLENLKELGPNPAVVN
ncbi:hydrogenase iron-sulfur subunit [Desulfospira joergensenii]|uniref:hydrogenase iron-sulfur subunit n=1 Tax=Desulfospira joergensenii TaxID=53329 RepID=UPI0003B3FBBD|nr:hydrogenase iron-sulfur subunit [Desulfospira joergensenii]